MKSFKTDDIDRIEAEAEILGYAVWGSCPTVIKNEDTGDVVEVWEMGCEEIPVDAIKVNEFNQMWA